jgi:RimJ/RimL family protein N-acetyltransferase
VKTDRLILRQWRQEDHQAFAALNADPNVMAHFPAILSAEESQQSLDRHKNIIEKNGWGFWATELIQASTFIGFVGLLQQQEGNGILQRPFVEIGWRLAAEHWGKGYAPEAARRALKYGFEELQLAEIYSFTTLDNQNSQRVMHKIGMQNTQQDFNHPKLPSGHPQERHCLYKITRQQWIDLN